MSADVVLSNREALESLFVLNADQIDALPWTPVADCPGVTEKVLWHLGDFVQALIRYQPLATTPGEAHLAAHHHICVVSGSATIAGQPLTGGSYVHVPPGVDHPVTDVGAAGCTLLQMHRPHAPAEAEALAAEA